MTKARGRGLRKALAGAAMVVAVAAGCAGGSDASAPAAPYLDKDGIFRVPVKMVDMRFVPEEVTVPAGRDVIVEVSNTDGMPHDLAMENGPATALLPRGAAAELKLGKVTGPLAGWCTVTGHRAAGMVFTVQVAS